MIVTIATALGIFLTTGCSMSFFSLAPEEPAVESSEEAAVVTDQAMATQTDDSKPKELVSEPEGDKDSSSSDENFVPVPGAKIDDLSLQQAKLWARMADLEQEVKVQKAQISILARKQKLGIVAGAGPLVSAEPAEEAAEEEPMLEVSDSEYQDQLQAGRRAYGEGEYVRAYEIFDQLVAAFPNHDGEPLYWMGRCWYALREYRSAFDQLRDLISGYPNFHSKNLARLYLARAQLELGMSEKAIENLQGLLKEDPLGGSAEAARELLTRLGSTL